MARDFDDVDGDCNPTQPSSDDSECNIHDEIAYEAAMQDVEAEIQEHGPILGKLTGPDGSEWGSY
jgi:hypothetical protein